MNAATSIPTTQTQQKPGFRKIMTWNNKRSSKKLPHLSYDSAPEGDDKTSPVPASPTHSLRSLKTGRPSLFATFARRNSTKSEHSSRSRSPTSPRPSNDLIFTSDGIRTPSPTPSRNSMIFERDIEFHDHLSVHEAIDLAIPPVLDDAAEAFVNEEIPTILTEENVNEPGSESKSDNGKEKAKVNENGNGKQGVNAVQMDQEIINDVYIIHMRIARYRAKGSFGCTANLYYSLSHFFFLCYIYYKYIYTYIYSLYIHVPKLPYLLTNGPKDGYLAFFYFGASFFSLFPVFFIFDIISSFFNKKKAKEVFLFFSILIKEKIYIHFF